MNSIHQPLHSPTFMMNDSIDKPFMYEMESSVYIPDNITSVLSFENNDEMFNTVPWISSNIEPFGLPLIPMTNGLLYKCIIKTHVFVCYLFAFLYYM